MIDAVAATIVLFAGLFVFQKVIDWYNRNANAGLARKHMLAASIRSSNRGPIVPGYYDVAFIEFESTMDDDGEFGPETPRRVVWLGARVLMLDDNGDAIVEHYPDGWRGVERRIDRIPARNVETTHTFTPVPMPSGVPAAFGGAGGS